MNGPKPDSILVEDMQYITVEEDMKAMPVSSYGDADVDAASGLKSIKREAVVNPEVESFVTSLVDTVVEKLARMATAGGDLCGLEKKAVAESPSNEAVDGSCSSVPNKSTVAACDAVKGEDKIPPTVGANTSKVAVSKEKEMLSNSGDASSGATTRTGPQLFGSNGECEDIQTSLQKMERYLDKLKALAAKSNEEDNDKALVAAKPESESTLKVKVDIAPERDQDVYLTALRTKYGAGVSGCAEQVITLVDYYRDFERRTDLNEIWKMRITKLEKIESSLSEYVQFLNIPVALRQDFIKVKGALLVWRYNYAET